MTTVTPSDQAGAASAKRPATIPTQRSGQALRLLVLGAGEDAAAFRARAAEAGAELAQRFSVRVTHVVVEEGVGEDDARVVRARGAGLPVLGLVEGARLVEERASGTSEAPVEVGEEGEAADVGAGKAGVGVGVEVEVETRGARADRAGMGAARASVDEVDRADGVDRADAVPLIRPRAEIVSESADGGPSDVFTGSALEAMMQFPPLPVDEFEGGDGEADADVSVGVEMGAQTEKRTGVETEKRTGVEAEIGIGTGTGMARVVGSSVGDEAPSVLMDSVLMDVASAACARAEAGVEIAGEEKSGEAGDRAGAADERVRGAAVDGATRLDGAALLKLAAARGESTAAGRASSIAWALVPLVSLGLLTPVAIGYAAYRLRSRSLAAATACYTVAIIAAFAVSAVLPVHTRAQSIIGDLMTTCLAASWLGGTAHSFMLRRRVFGLSK